MTVRFISVVATVLLLASCGGGGGGGGGGSGGQPAAPAIEFNEILANPAAGGAWVEIHNPGAGPVGLDGLRVLTDSGAEAAFPIGAGTLDAGAYTTLAIALATGPDRAVLVDPKGTEIAAVAWPALAAADPDPLRGWSYGLTSRGTWRLLSDPTPGAANTDPVHAVILNEMSADNDTSLENPDRPGSFDDWIEILNPSSATVDLGGFTLSDDLGVPDRWTVPPGTMVPAGGYLIVHADEGVGGLHANFKLSNGGEEVGLFAPDGALVDAFVYAQMGSDRSRGRERDGAAAWISFRGPTPGGPNHAGLIDQTDDPAHRERDPDLDFVFDASVVRRIDIVVPPTEFARMQEDLADQLALLPIDRDYRYFECTVGFEGDLWEHVGVRYKGTSSIQTPAAAGQAKLPLKLDFDEFEDLYPAWLNQRFFGLKKLTFANGYADPTLERELLCLDLMRRAGVTASRAAPMAVWVDTGPGPRYWGLYTMVEQVDDVFLKDRFGDDSGNLYKPEGAAADLTRFIESSFTKKTNEDEADFDDVKNLIAVLNATYPDLDQQRAAIEAVLDVDGFLAWLAVSNAICNFDTYANREHNYYLYFHQDDGRARFITWDHNMAFASPIPPFAAATAHEWNILDPTADDRPLIDRILEVPEWDAEYRRLVLELLDGPLAETAMTARAQSLHALLRPFVAGPDGESAPYTLLRDPLDFDRGLTETLVSTLGVDIPGLLPFLTARRAYLNSVLR